MTDAPSIERCRRWLEGRGHAFERLEELAGDVSARRYFRLHRRGPSRVVAGYPADLRAACERWLTTDRLLSGAGVRTPRTLDADCDHGFVLLEDVGPSTLYERFGRDWEEARPWLVAAIGASDRIAGLDADAVERLQPALAEAVLAAELDRTWTLYLEPRGLCGDDALAAALRRGLEDLVEALGAGPLVPCHRDFMVRNLVPLPGGAVAVLDHQDLRLGPPYYDLASLTNDTIYLPDDAVDALLGRRLEDPGARSAFHRAAAQRTLKIVGTFEAFRRRGDARHVPLIRPALEAALRHLGRLPETAPLVDDLAPLWTAEPLC